MLMQALPWEGYLEEACVESLKDLLTAYHSFPLSHNSEVPCSIQGVGTNRKSGLPRCD